MTTNQSRSWPCIGRLVFSWYLMAASMAYADQVDDWIAQANSDQHSARLAAVQKLGESQEPRAAAALLKLFDKAITKDEEREELWVRTTEALRSHAVAGRLDESAFPVLERVVRTEPKVTRRIERRPEPTFHYQGGAMVVGIAIRQRIARDKLEAELQNLPPKDRLAHVVREAWKSFKYNRRPFNEEEYSLSVALSYVPRNKLLEFGLDGIAPSLAALATAEEEPQQAMTRYFRELFARTKNPKCLDALLTMVERSKLDGPRREALRTLEEIHDRSIVDRLQLTIERVNPADNHVVATGLFVLGRLEATSALPFMIEKYKGNDLTMSMAAGSALVDLGQHAIPALTELLASDDLKMRERAAITLARIDSPKRDQILRDYLTQNPAVHPHVVESIEEALEKSRKRKR